MAFTNKNICRSFNQTISNSLVALSSQRCSEVIVVNKTGTTIEIYDNGFSGASNAMSLSADCTFTFRGVTDSNQVSAKTIAGSGSIYYRTQYFSDSSQNT